MASTRRYPLAGPHGGRPRQRQRPTATPATAMGSVFPLVLGSAASPFEATRQPSSRPPKAEDLRPDPLTGERRQGRGQSRVLRDAPGRLSRPIRPGLDQTPGAGPPRVKDAKRARTQDLYFREILWLAGRGKNQRSSCDVTTYFPSFSFSKLFFTRRRGRISPRGAVRGYTSFDISALGVRGYPPGVCAGISPAALKWGGGASRKKV